MQPGSRYLLLQEHKKALERMRKDDVKHGKKELSIQANGTKAKESSDNNGASLCNILPLPPTQVCMPTATATSVSVSDTLVNWSSFLLSLPSPSHLATKEVDINQIIFPSTLATVTPASCMPTATSAFDTLALVDNTSWPSLALPSPSHHYDDCSVEEVDIDDEVIRGMWMACD